MTTFLNDVGECFGETEYVAKRAHRHPCDLCGEAIAIDDKCIRWRYVYDGRASLIRAHKACDDEARGKVWYTCWTVRFPLAMERAGEEAY